MHLFGKFVSLCIIFFGVSARADLVYTRAKCAANSVALPNPDLDVKHGIESFELPALPCEGAYAWYYEGFIETSEGIDEWILGQRIAGTADPSTLGTYGIKDLRLKSEKAMSSPSADQYFPTGNRVRDLKKDEDMIEVIDLDFMSYAEVPVENETLLTCDSPEMEKVIQKLPKKVNDPRVVNKCYFINYKSIDVVLNAQGELEMKYDKSINVIEYRQIYKRP